MPVNDIFSFLNNHPIFFLATCIDNQPRVRAMRLYSADKNGIIFNTSHAKSLHRQLQNNPAVELCFYDDEDGVQIRIRGTAVLVEDPRIRNGMADAAPALATVIQDEGARGLAIYRISQGTARVWKTDEDYIPKLMTNVELSSIWMAMYDGAPGSL
ncbi:MAG: pyridoxamine 5'-phosphate oxidase family protein [Phycisphaerae bacterium]|nr:pyridoxamine 5'-phosphate oxidase family protein [Phycisphaerae bacterium]